MASIDAWYLEDPASGSRRMVEYLAAEGIEMGRDRVRHLMRRMGLRALHSKPRSTIPGNPAERFPCFVALGRFMHRMRSGKPILPTSHFARDFSTWWPSSIFTPGIGSAGDSQTDLTRSSLWMLWRWRWKASTNKRYSHPKTFSVQLI